MLKIKLIKQLILEIFIKLFTIKKTKRLLNIFKKFGNHLEKKLFIKKKIKM
jgi:hypothetical protein